jgi:hypothetical protein
MFAKGDTRDDYELTDDFQLGPTGPSDFSLTPASNNLDLRTAGQATDIIMVAPVGGSWDSAVQLSCAVTGPSPTATCGLTPSSVTPGANTVTSMLTVTAPMVGATEPTAHIHLAAYAILTPLVFGFTLAGSSRKQSKSSWLLCSLVMILPLFQAACGGGNSSRNTTQTQAVYTVIVTATSGATQHSAQVIVTVP